MERLDPTLDVVFKLLLTRSPELLRTMLEAVLGETIESLTILNPEIPGELSIDRAVVLDIRVRLVNNKRVDVEMQIRATKALASRLVYYAARDHADQLRRGDTVEKLTPTIVVVWLAEPLFPTLERYHSIFELRERNTAELFSDQLCIHLLQLAFLTAFSKESSPHEAAVRRWGRFLVARTDAELQALAEEDPIMDAAKSALEELSQDPDAYRLARERADSMKLYRWTLAETRQEGKIEGKVEAILAVLHARRLFVSEEAKARIRAQNDPAVLDRWLGGAATSTSVDALFVE